MRGRRARPSGGRSGAARRGADLVVDDAGGRHRADGPEGPEQVVRRGGPLEPVHEHLREPSAGELDAVRRGPRASSQSPCSPTPHSLRPRSRIQSSRGEGPPPDALASSALAAALVRSVMCSTAAAGLCNSRTARSGKAPFRRAALSLLQRFPNSESRWRSRL